MIAVEEKVLKPKLNPPAAALLAEVGLLLTPRNIKAFLVGGFVRHLLLETDTADIDLAVTADALVIGPGVAAALGGSFVPLDEENGTGRVVLAGQEQWTIDLSTISGDIAQDLGRRDFSVNAMAVDLANIDLTPGQPAFSESDLLDPFGGRADLDKKVIRALNDDIFGNDPVRLLRAVRLAAELGFSIDGHTEALIKKSGHLLESTAAERCRDELIRLLAVPDAEPLWPYIDSLGLITAIIPEMAPAKGVSQPKEHAWDVFDHSVRTMASADFLLRQGSWLDAGAEVLAVVPWNDELAAHFAQKISGSSRRTLTKLAALLHDIAKPQTKMIDETGRTRFFGHAVDGAGMAAAVLKRLRFSGKEIKLVEAMVRYHLRPPQMSQAGTMPSPRAIYHFYRDAADAGTETLYLSLADHLAARGPQLDMANWREHAGLVAYVMEQRRKQEELVTPPRLVTGHELMEAFSLKPGPRIGRLLEALREAQAAGELATREEALAWASNLLTKGTGEEES
jgi:poly(A) polymerase